MTSRRYLDSSYRAYGTPNGLHPHFSVADSYTNRYPSLELYAFQQSFPTDDATIMLPAHHAAVRNSGLSAALPIIQPANLPLLQASQDNGVLAGTEVLGIYPAQPHVSTPTSRSIKAPHLNIFQTTHPSYTEKAIQTISSHAAGEFKGSQDKLQARQLVSRELAPQEIYRPARRQTEFGNPGVVEFVVDNKEGIRLSDVLEGNWEGFEGRDDRSLFEDDRLQIIFRLHVRSSACMYR
jgi:hypothetical protein